MMPALGAEASAKAARVIGAGLSGLAAAWHLADRGFDVTVSDRAPQAGGLIGTIETPYGLVETAANAFVWSPVVEAWFKRLDLMPVFPGPASRRRYIFRAGEPRRWPLACGESIRLAARLAGATLSRSTRALAGERMDAWGHRVLGAAGTHWLLEPAMQGIYASPLHDLSARAIWGGRRRGSRQLAAPAAGMGQFATRLYDRLRDRGVGFEFNRSLERLDDRRPTIICTSAADAASLVAPHAPNLGRALASVCLRPLTTATMFFAPHTEDTRGFGVLFPSGSGVNALGVLFNTDIFEGRGTARSETWIVGDRGKGLGASDDDGLLSMLLNDRRFVTGRGDPPLDCRITRWRQAIPVYDDTILAVAKLEDSLPPWLALAGNYLGRIGVAALLEQAEAAAGRVRAV